MAGLTFDDITGPAPAAGGSAPAAAPAGAPAAPALAANGGLSFDDVTSGGGDGAPAPAADASPPPTNHGTLYEKVRDALPYVNGLVRSAANSVPILGAYADKLDAATDSAISGKSADQAMADQKAQDATFASQNPVSSGAAGFAGAAGGSVAMLPEWGLGAVGGIGERMLGSAVGGGTLGTADAMTRGDNPAGGAVAGAIGGAAGPLVAKGVGAGIRGVTGLMQGAPASGPLQGLGSLERRWLNRAVGDATPEQMQAAADGVGQAGFFGERTPGLLDLQGSIADNTGAGKATIRDGYQARMDGRNDRVNGLVDQNLGPMTNPTAMKAATQDQISQLGAQRAGLLSGAGPIDASSVVQGLQDAQGRYAPNSQERAAIGKGLGWVTEEAKPGAAGSTWEPDPVGSGAPPDMPGPSLESRVFHQAVPADPTHSIVPVDVDKVDALTGWQPDYRIAPGEGGPTGKLARASDFISGMGDDVQFRPPQLGVHDQGMGFDDGRHRFAAMRDLGFKTAPVSMDPESAAAARRLGLVNDAPAAGGGAPADAPGFPATPDGYGAAPTRPGPVGVPRPQDLHAFVRSLGGIQDSGGDLASMGYDNLIARQGQGLGADAMRQAAAQMGYLNHTIDGTSNGATRFSTVNDLLDALGSDNPIYSAHDEDAVHAWAARDAAMADYQQRGGAGADPTARPAGPRPTPPGLPDAGPGFDPNSPTGLMAPIQDATQLHNAKQNFDKHIEWQNGPMADPNTSIGYAEGAFKDARGGINAALRDQVEGYGANQDAQAALFGQNRALDTGMEDLRANKDPARYPPNFAQDFDALTPEQQAARRAGQRFDIGASLGNKADDFAATRQLLQGDGGWNTANLAHSFGAEPIGNVTRGLDQEVQMAANKNEVMGGSQTTPKAQRTTLTQPDQQRGLLGIWHTLYNARPLDQPGSVLPKMFSPEKLGERFFASSHERARANVAPYLMRTGPEADELQAALLAQAQLRAKLAPPTAADPLIQALMMGGGQYAGQ